MSEKLPKRWLLSFDGERMYLREILCITHDAVSGEARYDTKVLPSRKISEAVARASRYALRPETRNQP